MKTKLKIHFLIIAVSLTSLLGGYIQSLSVPIYAADDWETLTSNEQLVDAFKVYCKSRNTVIDGSVLDAVTSFTTSAFNNLCNTLGIDVTLLQAELHRSYTGSGYKYAFSQLGLSTYNRIFAEFLQNNDLAVGDQVDDQTIYTGAFFRGYFLYEINRTNEQGNFSLSYLSKKGTPLVSSDYFRNIFYSQYPSYSFNSVGVVTNTNYFDFLDYSQSFKVRARISYGSDLARYGNIGVIYDYAVPAFTRPDASYTFNPTFCYVKLSNNKIFSACLTTDSLGYFTYYCFHNYDSSSATQADIYITTNNTTINNETTINEGDTYIIDSDGQPDGGGGSGSDDDDWDPSVPTIPPAGGGTGNNNTINWPDIDIPDFNLPDFSLGDITDKFPFSIPFDLVALLTVLDGEPIAPHIEGTIPLGDFYTWDLDFDFSQFDNYARLFRAFEFIGFCIGLIYFTVRIVKG